jgi:hypothetical protein
MTEAVDFVRKLDIFLKIVLRENRDERRNLDRGVVLVGEKLGVEESTLSPKQYKMWVQ